MLSALMTLTAPLVAKQSSLDDGKIVETLAKHIVKAQMDKYEPGDLGRYLLEKEDSGNYYKIKGDDFELEDQSTAILAKFKKELAELPQVNKEKKYDLYMNARFDKYDFKKKGFKLQRVLEEGIYMIYKGRVGPISGKGTNSVLNFDNLNDESIMMYLDKAKAKALIGSRKDKGGNVNREILAHYVYTIEEYKERYTGRQAFTPK